MNKKINFKKIKHIFVGILIGIIALPTITLGGTFVSSLVQGKTVEGAVQTLTEQLNFLIGRVEVIEIAQIEQEQTISELQTIIDQQKAQIIEKEAYRKTEAERIAQEEAEKARIRAEQELQRQLEAEKAKQEIEKTRLEAEAAKARAGVERAKAEAERLRKEVEEVKRKAEAERVAQEEARIRAEQELQRQLEAQRLAEEQRQREIARQQELERQRQLEEQRQKEETYTYHDYFPIILSLSDNKGNVNKLSQGNRYRGPHTSSRTNTTLKIGDEIYLKIEASDPQNRQILYNWSSNSTYFNQLIGLEGGGFKWTTNNELRYKITAEDIKTAGETMRIVARIKSEKEFLRYPGGKNDDSIYLDYTLSF